LLQKIVHHFTTISSEPAMIIKDSLKKRELDLIDLVCKGCSNKEIADKLFVSVKTVENSKSRLFEKIGIHSSLELVAFAIKNKIIAV
jgi:DNA-binding NarL/FixJ family response regulator